MNIEFVKQQRHVLEEMHQNFHQATCLVQLEKVYGTMEQHVGDNTRLDVSVQLFLELAFLVKLFRLRLLIELNQVFLHLPHPTLLWFSPPLLFRPLQISLLPSLTLNSSSKYKKAWSPWWIVYFFFLNLIIVKCSVLVLFWWDINAYTSRLVVENSKCWIIECRTCMTSFTLKKKTHRRLELCLLCLNFKMLCGVFKDRDCMSQNYKL